MLRFSTYPESQQKIDEEEDQAELIVWKSVLWTHLLLPAAASRSRFPARWQRSRWPSEFCPCDPSESLLACRAPILQTCCRYEVEMCRSRSRWPLAWGWNPLNSDTVSPNDPPHRRRTAGWWLVYLQGERTFLKASECLMFLLSFKVMWYFNSKTWMYKDELCWRL